MPSVQAASVANIGYWSLIGRWSFNDRPLCWRGSTTGGLATGTAERYGFCFAIPELDGPVIVGPAVSKHDF